MKPSSLILAALVLLPACSDTKDGTSDTTSSATASSATAMTEGSSGDATEGSSGDPTDGSSGDTTGVMTDGSGSSSGGGQPVECGDAVCAANELCVTPALRCDYNLDPPDYVQDAPACAALPPDCAADDVDCVGLALCGETEFVPHILVGGQLTCTNAAPDCF